MSIHEPVNGEDYLVDYYAVLGIERTASQEEITKAYRAKQMQYHPDRFQGLAPEMLNRLQSHSHIFNEAYAVLDDEEKRKEYDEKLLGWKKAVSTDGVPVVDFSQEGFSFASLLDNITGDPEAREAEAEKLAIQFSGFDKATYEFICKVAETGAGLPPEMRQAYLEQLERREFYLSLRESMIWDSMGVHNHNPVPQLEYVEQFETQFEEVRTQATAHVEQQVLRLTAGETTLLLSPPDSEGEAVEPSKVLAHYQARLDEHFERQTALLKPLAEEREKVVGARFNLAADVTYHPDTKEYTPKVIVEIKTGEESRWFSFIFDIETLHVKGDNPEGLETLSDPAVAREWIANGYTILSFHGVQGIEFMSQLDRVLNQHAERIKGDEPQETVG